MIFDHIIFFLNDMLLTLTFFMDEKWLFKKSNPAASADAVIQRLVDAEKLFYRFQDKSGGKDFMQNVIYSQRQSVDRLVTRSDLESMNIHLREFQDSKYSMREMLFVHFTFGSIFTVSTTGIRFVRWSGESIDSADITVPAQLLLVPPVLCTFEPSGNVRADLCFSNVDWCDVNQYFPMALDPWKQSIITNSKLLNLCFRVLNHDYKSIGSTKPVRAVFKDISNNFRVHLNATGPGKLLRWDSGKSAMVPYIKHKKFTFALDLSNQVDVRRFKSVFNKSTIIQPIFTVSTSPTFSLKVTGIEILEKPKKHRIHRTLKMFKKS